MVKVIEHSELASKQFDSLYARSESEIGNLTSNLNRLKKQQDSIKDNYDKVKNKYDEIEDGYGEIKAENQRLSSNLITILGIFTAITFAIFGGLQLLGNIFGKAISTNGTDHFIIGNTIILCGFFILSIGAIMVVLFEEIGRITSQNLKISKESKIIVVSIVIFMIVSGLIYSKK